MTHGIATSPREPHSEPFGSLFQCWWDVTSEVMGSSGAAVVVELLEKSRTAVGENGHLRSHGLMRAEISIDRTLVIRVFNRPIFLAFHLLTGITGNVDAHVVI
jgi:hypothetical protein